MVLQDDDGANKVKVLLGGSLPRPEQAALSQSAEGFFGRMTFIGANFCLLSSSDLWLFDNWTSRDPPLPAGRQDSVDQDHG